MDVRDGRAGISARRRELEGGVTVMIRQGDVLLVTARLPKGAKLRHRARRIVLAEGEATGHAHAVVAGPGAPDVELYEGPDGSLYCRTVGAGTLVHEEHEIHDVSHSTSRVIRQREYDEVERARQVAD